MRDKVVISGNSGIVNYRSTLTNVTQTIETIDQGSPADRAELKQLVEALFAEIEKLPEAAAKDGADLARKTKSLVADIDAGADKDTLGDVFRTMGRIGNKLLGAAPKIAETVGSIVKLVDKF